MFSVETSTSKRLVVISAAGHVSRDGEIMDALAAKQVASAIRIVPDPGKDIEMNILSQFDYSHELPISTVETLVDALDRLLEQNAEHDRKELEAQIAR